MPLALLGASETGVGRLLGEAGINIDTSGIKGVVDDITGRSAADAARDAARQQEAAGQRAITVAEDAQLRLEEQLAPFVGALGTDLLPQVQTLFGAGAGEAIMQDPALQALLDESQRRIQAQQSAQGRPLAETDILLQDAFLRTGSDLLSRQRGDLLSALGIGQASAAQTGASGVGTASSVGNLLTQIANAQAGGTVGAAQAQAAGTQNLLNTGLGLLGLFASDKRLKKNISKIGKYKDHNLYKYQYKHSDDWHIGVMAQEAREITPEAVIEVNGYLMVNYGAL